MTIELPKRCQQLYDALAGEGDVPFAVLCEAIDANLGPTASQQWLGPYVTRLNRRLKAHGLTVKPGAIKGTYRLIVT
jgi:hypothetical protein